jgi:hypothetical protein
MTGSDVANMQGSVILNDNIQFASVTCLPCEPDNGFTQCNNSIKLEL